jgi:hypothetical protein
MNELNLFDMNTDKDGHITEKTVEEFKFSSLDFFIRRFNLPTPIKWGILEIISEKRKNFCICVYHEEKNICVDVQRGEFVSEQDYGELLTVKIHPAIRIEGFDDMDACGKDFTLEDEPFQIISKEYIIEASEKDFKCWYQYQWYTPELEGMSILPKSF